MSEGECVHLLCLCWQPCAPPPPTSQAIFHPNAAVHTAEGLKGVGVGVARRVAGKMVGLQQARDWGVGWEDWCHSVGSLRGF